MHIARLRQYIPTTLAAIWLAACEVHEAPTEAAVEAVFVTPVAEEMPAGTRPPRPLVAPPPPQTIAPTEPSPEPAPDHGPSPRPRRTVPETYEMEAPAPALPPMPSPPAYPSRQITSPPDGMPVLETPTVDGMRVVPGTSSDPMPMLTGPLARLEDDKEARPLFRN
jgi:hypothetical protein